MGGSAMALSNIEIQNLEVLGLYRSFHPGMDYLLGGTSPTRPNWWAMIQHKGQPVNLYRLAHEGDVFWYPAGHLGIKRGIKRGLIRLGLLQLDAFDMLTHISPLLERLRQQYRLMMLSNDLYINIAEHVPVNWLDGLWYLSDQCRRDLCGDAQLRCANQVRRQAYRYRRSFRPTIREFSARERDLQNTDIKAGA